MTGIELIIVLLAIWLGASLGGIGIGFAGGLGILVLTLVFGVKPGLMPFDVIEIIMAVISATAAMQIAGGMDYIVALAERFLRKNPKYITFFAPLATYTMTLLAGTGHTAFSTLPVITEIAKEHQIRPSKPLSLAVVASQIAITASPLSAAVVLFSSMLESYGINYFKIIQIQIPSTVAGILVSAFITNFFGKNVQDYCTLQSSATNYNKISEIKKNNRNVHMKINPTAKYSVFIFLLGIIAVMLYSIAINENIALISNPVLSRNDSIVVFMLTVAAIICLICKINTHEILNASTFKSGMSACICIMGVAWLGDTFVQANINYIQRLAGTMLKHYPWMLGVVLFFTSTFLYSQAVTTKAIMPAALMLGVPPLVALASFPAVSALFVLPTYPTLIAAVEMDDTGSTKIGKYIFNHSFIIPGIIAIVSSVMFGFLFCRIIF